MESVDSLPELRGRKGSAWRLLNGAAPFRFRHEA